MATTGAALRTRLFGGAAAPSLAAPGLGGSHTTEALRQATDRLLKEQASSEASAVGSDGVGAQQPALDARSGARSGTEHPSSECPATQRQQQPPRPPPLAAQPPAASCRPASLPPSHRWPPACTARSWWRRRRQSRSWRPPTSCRTSRMPSCRVRREAAAMLGAGCWQRTTAPAATSQACCTHDSRPRPHAPPHHPQPA